MMEVTGLSGCAWIFARPFGRIGGGGDEKPRETGAFRKRIWAQPTDGNVLPSSRSLDRQSMQHAAVLLRVECVVHFMTDTLARDKLCVPESPQML